MRTEHRSGETQAVRHVAVIGSGIAGLSAAWLLSRAHRVSLYEAEGRAGGHANTVMVPTGATQTAVDTGFIVYNERNYPNFTALLDHLGVMTQRSDMSFAASLDGGRVEYSSDGFMGLLGKRSSFVGRRYWTMLRDVCRFYAEAPRAIAEPANAAMTLGDYLDANGYSPAFVEDHLLPMGAAIWSTTARQMRDHPLVAFVRFFIHHGLLDIFGQPRWRTVTGGSIAYVRRLLGGIHDLRLGAGVAQIRREHGGVTVIDARGERQWFTDVVIATHADAALKLLADADETEARLLGAFGYTDNVAVLHRDPALMPKRQRLWASWNYVGEPGAAGERPLCVSYWMNRLQSIDRRHPLFVTLNPVRDIAPDRMIRSFAYRHPLFDRKAIETQQYLWRLQGVRNTYFAGAYFGHGFHEDALQSGLAAAEAIGGVRRPWRVAAQASRIALAPQLEAAE